ncbi:MAG: hypothetical protein AAGB93_11115 [Planctomycetota bacterium]
MLALLLLATSSAPELAAADPPSAAALHAGTTRGAIASAGDVDGDGVPDVHVAGRLSGTVDGQPFQGVETAGSIWTLSGADGSVLRRHDLTGPAGGTEWLEPGYVKVFGRDLANAGDLDGDGVPDLVASGFVEGHAFSALVDVRSGRTGEVLRSVTTDETPGALRWSHAFAVAGGADLDFDGTPDVLIGRSERDPAVIALSGRTWQPIFEFTAKREIGECVAFLPGLRVDPRPPVLGDVRPRVLFGGSRYYERLAPSATVLTADGKPLQTARSGVWDAAALGDLDGDGQQELLLSDCHYGVIAVSGATGETIWDHSSARGRENNEGFSLAVLDADEGLVAIGANELVHWGLGVESDRGQVKVIRVGEEEPAWSLEAPLYGGFDVAAPGDVDGDGVADLALVERRTQRAELRSGADLALVLWTVDLEPLARARDAALAERLDEDR